MVLFLTRSKVGIKIDVLLKSLQKRAWNEKDVGKEHFVKVHLFCKCSLLRFQRRSWKQSCIYVLGWKCKTLLEPTQSTSCIITLNNTFIVQILVVLETIKFINIMGRFLDGFEWWSHLHWYFEETKKSLGGKGLTCMQTSSLHSSISQGFLTQCFMELVKSLPFLRV